MKTYQKEQGLGMVLTILIIAAVIIAGGYFYLQAREEARQAESLQSESMMEEGEDMMMEEDMMGRETARVSYTDGGFAQKDITINAGDTVRFTNDSSRPFWPASAFHPTHTVYPGSDIKKCGRSSEQNIFDACRAHTPGESYSFTFTEKGKWNYHDHLNVSSSGSITVK